MLKRIVLYILLFVIVYLYINNPLFVFTGGSESIRWLYVLFPLALLIYPSLFKEYLRHFRPYIIVFLFIVLYLSFVWLSGGEPRYFTKSITATIEDVLLPFVFFAFFYVLRLTEKQFISFLLLFGCACAFISVLCIFNPTIASYFRESISVGNDYLDTHLYRGFGLSYSLTYAYGISLAIILVAGIHYIHDNKWFIFATPFILLSILLNARTGAIVVIAGLILTLFAKKRRSGFIIAPIVIIALFFGFTMLISSEKITDASLAFVEDFSYALSGYASGEEAGAISVLRTQWLVPDDIVGWLIGQGVDVYKMGGKNHSDIGFFIQLNYGGLVYLGLLLLLVSKVTKFFFDNKEHFWGYFFLATFLIANYKGQFLLASGCFRLFLMIMTFYIYCRRVSEKGNRIKSKIQS